MTGEEIEAIFDALEAPFEPHEVKTRPGDRKGLVLRYVDAPTVRRRLNQAVGRDNWECAVDAYPNGVRCALTIRLPDGRSLTRAALGGYPKMDSTEDSFKGGDSDAFKRAAALFGVAAYLNDDLHADAEPARPPHRKPRHEWAGAKSAGVPAETAALPRTGKALFARLKQYEQDHPESAGLLKYLNGWARLQEFPPRMVDWNAGQVADAYAEARRKLAEYQRSDQVQEALSS